MLNDAARAILLVAPDMLAQEYSPGPGSSGSADGAVGMAQRQAKLEVWRQSGGGGGGS